MGGCVGVCVCVGCCWQLKSRPWEANVENQLRPWESQPGGKKSLRAWGAFGMQPSRGAALGWLEVSGFIPQRHLVPGQI